jgi:hypothetical protein
MVVDTDQAEVTIRLSPQPTFVWTNAQSPSMDTRLSRVMILFFLGLSVSIAPVRAHYALTTQGASASRSSSLLPRSQQRIRLISMRSMSAEAARPNSRCACESNSHFASRPEKKPTSWHLAPAYPITGHAILSCLVHPLRC